MSHRAALIQCLVRDLYGPAASIVVCLLNKTGRLTGREIQEQCQLPTRMLQNILIVLYKHSCIEVYIVSEKDRTILRYGLNAEGILMNLRRSKYLLFAHDRWGHAGKFILLQFLKSGFITPEAAVKGAISDFNNLRSTLYGEENISQHEYSTNRMKQVLELMYTSGYLRVCPTMDDLCKRAVSEAERLKQQGLIAPAIMSARAKSNARKRGEDDIQVKRTKRVTKKRRAGDIEMITASGGGGATAGSLEAENALFGEIPRDDSERRTGSSRPSSNNNQSRGGGGGAAGSSGAKKDRIELPASPFKVNYDHINLEMSKQVIENFVASRWNNATIVRFIARALLSHARKSGIGIFCEVMSFEDLCVTVNKLVVETNAQSRGEQLNEYDSDMLFKALENLTRHADKVIKTIKAGSGGGMAGYQLDWSQARGLLQHRIICQMIQTRFGLDATRVFALILDRDGQSSARIRAESGTVDCGANDNSAFLRYSRFWNDSEISEHALVSPSDARACASALAAAGFINKHAADVVGAAPPSVQNKHFWVFGTTEADALETAIESCYQYVANVFERKDVEVEKLQKLVLKAETLTPELEFEMTSREIAEDILEASLSGIDQALLVLRDSF